MSLDIQAAHGRERKRIEANEYPYPKTSEEFIEFICTLHRNVFDVTNLKFPGSIRTTEVFVGTGTNQFQGTAPENICSFLGDLFINSFPSEEFLKNASEEHFLRHCARFMEELLKIHPFADGNGRITRLCLHVIAQRSGRYRFRPFSTDPKSVDKYIEALEFGHRHNVRKMPGETEGRKKDPFKLLVNWLKAHIDSDQAGEDTEELEPDWIK